MLTRRQSQAAEQKQEEVAEGSARGGREASLRGRGAGRSRGGRGGRGRGAAREAVPQAQALAQAGPSEDTAAAPSKRKLPQIEEVQAGAQVKLKGLVARPELNARIGRLLKFIDATGRWQCEIESGTIVNVLPANIEAHVEVAGGEVRRRLCRKTATAVAERQEQQGQDAASATAAHDDVVMVESAEEDDTVAEPLPPASAQAAPVVKKRRGRPPKTDRTTAPGSGAAGSNGKVVTEVQTPAIPGKTGRRKAAAAAPAGEGAAVSTQPKSTAAVAAAPAVPPASASATNASARLPRGAASGASRAAKRSTELGSKMASDKKESVDSSTAGRGTSSGAGSNKATAAADDAAAADDDASFAAAELAMALAASPKIKPKQKPKPKRTAGDGSDDEDEDEELFDCADFELEEEEVVCLSSDEELTAEEDEDNAAALQVVGELDWPDVWQAAPGLDAPSVGTPGFNAYAGDCLSRARLGTADSPFAGLGMRLHQESASFLLSPKSPISRLLVDHATGTGKTLIIIRVLDNYFDDPRPKVVIFPKEAVCDNFYRELLIWPSRMRDFFCFSRPEVAVLASGVTNWKRKRTEKWDLNNGCFRQEVKRRGVRIEALLREMIDSVREVLDMPHTIHKGRIHTTASKRFQAEHPGAPVPRAPIRAFRYTTAGGGACSPGEDGLPNSPILKVGFDPVEKNPYSRKVVIMDECHNLVRYTPMYGVQLATLRSLLFFAKESVLAGFTGTPVCNEAIEGRKLLDVIKGDEGKDLNDEGFLSSFHARASTDFPKEVPVVGVPDGVIHEGMFGSLLKQQALHGEALKRYLIKDTLFQTTPSILILPEERRLAKLANYCNLHVHYGSCWGRNLEGLLNDTKGHAPKMYGIAKAVAHCPDKAVVFMSRTSGFKIMLEVLRRTGKKKGFRVATLDELGDFNDSKRNVRGERYRVLLAETSQAGEGISFRNVRRVHLLDVPLRLSDLVQRVSRCVRLGGHSDLPEDERVICIEQHVARLPKFLRQATGHFIYRELLSHKDIVHIPGDSVEAATMACLEELKKRQVKTLMDLQRELQSDQGEDLINLLVETALECMEQTSKHLAKSLAVALWRLRHGGDNVEELHEALCREIHTADDKLLERLADKSHELLSPLEEMRLAAVDRPVLACLGDPPKAPPPRKRAMAEHIREAESRNAVSSSTVGAVEEQPSKAGTGSDEDLIDKLMRDDAELLSGIEVDEEELECA
mmetsp:Transcript_33022/g.77185  ORF Transcript_33022/g.77185 Transcript_33022/m.77185 type:complete len:1223 (+) Transcript_33022:114-3782(+)